MVKIKKYTNVLLILCMRNIITHLKTLWLQIIPRRHSEFSQPAPRGFACSQNIAVVRTKRKKAPKGAFCSLCAPSWNRTNDLILKRDLLYQLSYGRITTQIYRK